MKVWTRAYRPFILGGDVHAPICCDLEPATNQFDLGKGFVGVIVVSPMGKKFVVELQSGGIVGNSIMAVRKDIESSDKETIDIQVEQMAEVGKTAIVVSEPEFWRNLKAS